MKLIRLQHYQATWVQCVAQVVGLVLMLRVP